jgi:hypothetical protein
LLAWDTPWICHPANCLGRIGGGDAAPLSAAKTALTRQSMKAKVKSNLDARMDGQIGTESLL